MLRHFGRAAESKAWPMAKAALKVSDPTTGDQRSGLVPSGISVVPVG